MLVVHSVRRKFCILLLSVSVCLVGSRVCSQTQLKGTIVHSEFLAPLTQQEEIGQVFEGTALYKRMMAYRNAPPQKFLVPEWLAGTWLRKEATETKRIELPSDGRCRQGH